MYGTPQNSTITPAPLAGLLLCRYGWTSSKKTRLAGPPVLLSVDAPLTNYPQGARQMQVDAADAHANEKFLASAKSTVDICREAGVLDGRLRWRADRLRSDPMNLVGICPAKGVRNSRVYLSTVSPQNRYRRRRRYWFGDRLAARASRVCRDGLRSRRSWARRQLGGCGNARCCSRNRTRRRNASPSDARKPAAVAGFRS